MIDDRPAAEAVGARETIHIVWSGTVEKAMTRLGESDVVALRSAADALEALDRVLRDDRNES